MGPRALFVATSLSENGIRMAEALAEVGFEVAAHCPAFHLFTQARGIRIFKSARVWWSLEDSLCRSVERWQPTVLLPCDDTAVRALHAIHGKHPRWAGLIERSLGSPEGFATAGSRARFLTLMAEAKGGSVPGANLVRNQNDLRSLIESSGFPLVLKQEDSGGGAGVRVVRTSEMARSAHAELARPPSLLHRLRRLVEHTILGTTQDGGRGNCAAIVAQRYIFGWPANRAVLCWRGRVVAGISVEVLQSLRETAPATVVRRIEHPEMDSTAALAVQLLGMSGFCGFDFILEEGSRRAWLLEMNPRLTPASHLPFGEGHDLAAALFELCVQHTARARPPLRNDTVAFFPRELARDPASPYLRGPQHDVPWDDPGLVAACIQRSAGLDFCGRARSLFYRARKCIPQFLLAPSNGARLQDIGTPQPHDDIRSA